jgi:hypothetical protein
MIKVQMAIAILSKLLFFLSIYVTQIQCARYQVMGSENETQYIQLKSQYDMLPGTVLSLPIDVPEEYLGIFGELPPRLKSITSPDPSGVYGEKNIYHVPNFHHHH